MEQIPITEIRDRIEAYTEGLIRWEIRGDKLVAVWVKGWADLEGAGFDFVVFWDHEANSCRVTNTGGTIGEPTPEDLRDYLLWKVS